MSSQTLTAGAGPVAGRNAAAGRASRPRRPARYPKPNVPIQGGAFVMAVRSLAQTLSWRPRDLDDHASRGGGRAIWAGRGHPHTAARVHRHLLLAATGQVGAGDHRNRVRVSRCYRASRGPPAAGGSVVVLAVFLAVTFASWLLIRAPGSSKGVLDITLYRLRACSCSTWRARRTTTAGVGGAARLRLAVAAWGQSCSSPTGASGAEPGRRQPAEHHVRRSEHHARFLTLCACAAVLMFAARSAVVAGGRNRIACPWCCRSRSPGRASRFHGVGGRGRGRLDNTQTSGGAGGRYAPCVCSLDRRQPGHARSAESAAMTLATLVTGSTNTSAPAPRATGQGASR